MAATLEAIRTKVRRLTRSPSVNLLSDADIDEYVNTFYQYDLPEELRLFTLKKTLTFWTQPNVDTYETDSTYGLTDYKNAIITIDSPVYIAGNESYFTQSREEFFLLYPISSYRVSIGTGDGVTTAFSGTLQNKPVMQHQVSFVSQDANGNALVLEDRVTSNADKNLVGDLYEPDGSVLAGGIDYVTGGYLFDFYLNGIITAPASGATIQAQTLPYQPSLPNAVLYYANAFTVRPVPDKAYKITFDAYVKPTALLNANDKPELEQWWQYLAYGAAKKVFEDRSDIEAVQQVMPELEHQERLVLRRTLVQRATQVAATIYSNRGTSTPFWNNSNNNF